MSAAAEFAHRQRVDIAGAAPAQIAGSRMMHGVGAAPFPVGREGQHPEGPAEPVVGEPPVEERAVAAIVLDHEQPDEEAGGDHRQQQAPTSCSRGSARMATQRQEWHQGDGQLGQAAASRGSR